MNNAYTTQLRENVPPDLRELDQWLLWKLEQRNGKPAKIPYQPTGVRADSTSPATWTTFETACAAFEQGEYNGMGFVFSDADPYTGIDFDHCVVDGVIDPERREWMFDLDSYSEFSQSGTGVHVICRASLPPGRRKESRLGVEMYDESRFFAMTGRRVPMTPKPIFDRQAAVEKFHRRVFGDPTPNDANQAPAQPVTVDDQELLTAIERSSAGAKFARLWAGDIAGYGSHSEADLALCNHLAFWTGRDAARMDRLFRRSGLMRAKWDRADYRKRTLNLAVAGTHETYTPSFTIPTINYSNGAGRMNGSDTKAEEPPKTKFRPLTLAELLNRPPKQWLMQDIFGPGDLIMLYGPSGSGKTFVAIDLIFSACLGRTWAGRFEAARPLTVAYCASEGVGGLSQRFAAARRHYGVDDLPGLFIFEDAPQLFTDKTGAGAVVFVAEIQAKQAAGGLPALDLLVIDTLHGATVAADENSAKDMGAALAAIKGIAAALGCAVLLVHHTNKVGVAERGSSALRGAMDAMLEIETNGETHLKCSKLKDGEVWQRQAFALSQMGASVRVLWREPGESTIEGGAKAADKNSLIAAMLQYPDKSFAAKHLSEVIAKSDAYTRSLLNELATDGKCIRVLDDPKKPPSSRNMWVYGVGVHIPEK